LEEAALSLVPLLTEHSHKHAAESAAIHTHSAERPPDLWKTGMTFRDTRCSAHARARSLRTRFVPATRSAGNRRVEHTAGHWQFDREDPRTGGQSSTAYELTEEITDETTPPITAAPAGHGAGAARLPRPELKIACLSERDDRLVAAPRGFEGPLKDGHRSHREQSTGSAGRRFLTDGNLLKSAIQGLCGDVMGRLVG
jgi:hypothetical protein